MTLNQNIFTINFGTTNVNFASAQDGLQQDYIRVCILNYAEQIKEHWKQNQGNGFRPWFSLIIESSDQSVITHSFDGIVPVRVDSEGNPLSIQRDLGEALTHNEQLRKGLKTNPYMESNNLALQGGDGEESMVVLQPSKGNIGRLFLEYGEVMWDEDDSFRLIYSRGNDKDDCFLKLDPTDAPSTGESKQGQAQFRKDLRTVMLSGMNEELRSRLNLFNSNGNAVEESDSDFFKVETDELHYIGRPASSVCSDGYFAAAYIEAFGQLTEVYKATGRKNKTRRFDISHVRAYLMPDIISKEGRPAWARKGKKFTDGVNPAGKNPSGKASSGKASSGKASSEALKQPKQETVAPQVSWFSVELSYVIEKGQRRWLTNDHDLAEKGWTFSNITQHFALFKKEGKVLLHLFGDVSAFEKFCHTNGVTVKEGIARTKSGNKLIVATGDYLGDITPPNEVEEVEYKEESVEKESSEEESVEEESSSSRRSSIASAQGVNEEFKSEVKAASGKASSGKASSDKASSESTQNESQPQAEKRGGPRGGAKVGFGKNRNKKRG